ncbi:MAG: SPFH domain-containing protein [Planctomycetota bacterium]
MSDDQIPDPAPSRAWVGGLLLAAVLAIPAYSFFYWFFCRIEVPPQHVCVLIKKTGDDLPPEHVIARHPNEKGIQLEVLLPGRHFRNPFFWDWQLRPYHSVPSGSVGVKVRLFGDRPDLSQNLLVPADQQLKGIVAEVLKPGDYPLNPYAYSVQNHPAIEVHAGHVGVVCNRVGATPKTKNTYLVEEGERGVWKQPLRQGAHYLNPYQYQVFEVDVRSQRLEFAAPAGDERNENDGATAVRFPSSDGFLIEVHLTVEWSIQAERAPEVLVRIGTGDPTTLARQILDKTLVPALRGVSRIQGSKYPAGNYISGELRRVFQESIFTALKATCGEQGIVIHSVLVNDIVPPQDIAAPIRAREVAKEEKRRNEVQLKQAIAEQSLAKQSELVKQETARVEAETETQKRVIAAKNAQTVALIEQEKLLTVANADLLAAKLQAEAIKARGEAQAAVIVAQNEAAAKALAASVAAFNNPGAFASYVFAQRMAPSVESVFADPGGPFGQLFRDLLQPREGEPSPARRGIVPLGARSERSERSAPEEARK